MIVSLRWEGDHEGHVVLVHQGDDAADPVGLPIDRPGDMVTAILDHEFREERQMCAAAVYGVCLAMRGVNHGGFIPQVLEKAIPFLSSVAPARSGSPTIVWAIMPSDQKKAREASIIGIVMCCPPAPRSRAKSAAVMAWAAV